MAHIRIIITKNGEIHVEAIGYEGPSCSLKTAPYIAALGSKTSDTPKSEMFIEEKQQQELGGES